MSGQPNWGGYNAVPSPPVHRYRVDAPEGRFVNGSPLHPLPENPFNRNSYSDIGSYPSSISHAPNSSRLEFDDIDPNSIADDDDPTDYNEPRHSPGSNSWNKPIGAGVATSYSHDDASGVSQPLQGTPNPFASSEKASWQQIADMDKRKRKRNMWLFIVLVAVLMAAGIVTGTVLAVRNNGPPSNPSSSSNSTSSGNGPGSDSQLTINSTQIKALMNNPDLHKVFPVIDYTPNDTQWPDCVASPPSQNNITMDMAVLSQLTPAVRLYGTDCNQTEMTLTAIDRLGMTDTIKVWLGVWIDSNQTTNARQLAQMYDVLAKYPTDHFLGVIVGNEVLFRKDKTEAQLISILNDVRQNFTTLGYDLSISTSDLGSSWNASLAAASDHVMGNIHPFFAGVTADAAASWTWNFWQQVDVAIAPEKAGSSVPRNIISETGWPSGGGNDCGTGTTCSTSTAGSVAGISEMNAFLEGWVCDANANGTMYFWFEAFDEPWKVVYNTPTEQWEDKWGLMTANRTLKQGLTIPNCNGKTF